MTGGGPANASNMFVFQIYTEAFKNLRMGVASALAVLMLLLVLVITFVQTRLRDRWVKY
jgi:multiple sugar transport system permease protein